MQKSNDYLSRLTLTLFELSPTKSQRAQVQIVEQAIGLFAERGRLSIQVREFHFLLDQRI